MNHPPNLQAGHEEVQLHADMALISVEPGMKPALALIER